MSTLVGRIRAAALAPDDSEVTFQRRGFVESDDGARQSLEEAGRVFLAGLRIGLGESLPAEINHRLAEIDHSTAGFGYEGAAMGVALREALSPLSRPLTAEFAAGAGSRHVYMVHVGAGWAMARIPRVLRSRVRLADPLLRWLAVDGFGFHQAYFETERYIGAGQRPRFTPPWPDPSGYAARALDQGIGRALWFVHGADPERVAAWIAGAQSQRRRDLWSGTGLAAGYAGGVGRDCLEDLVELSGRYRPELAQGAAFAVTARMRAGLVVEHTVDAADVLCGTGVGEAARQTSVALEGLPGDREVPGYEVWRRRIQKRFSLS